MSFQGSGVDISVVAAADHRTNQYRFMAVDNAGKVARAGAGAFALGVLQNNPNADQAATIRVEGISKVVAGAAVAVGSLVASDSAGRAIVATLARTNTSDAGAAADALIGSNVMGVALEAAGAAGDIIAIAIVRCGAVPTTAA
jgi:hypothetical protein